MKYYLNVRHFLAIAILAIGGAVSLASPFTPPVEMQSIFLDEVSSTEWYWMEDFYGLAEGRIYEFSFEIRKEPGCSAQGAFVSVMSYVADTGKKKENYLLAERLGSDVPADGKWHKVSGKFKTEAPAGKTFVRNVNDAFRASLILYNKGRTGKAVSIREFSGAPKYVTYDYLGEKDPDLPQILLIGDSTMMHTYTAKVKAFAGQAAIYYIPVNAGLTKTSIRKYRRWVGEKRWDVIYFNSGIHDLTRQDDKGKKSDDQPNRTPIDEYQENLRLIADFLKTTDADLIWRSITPFRDGVAGRSNTDMEIYNARAEKVMKAAGIPIHAVTASHRDELRALSSDGVHFSREGNELLAQLLKDYLAETGILSADQHPK